LCPNQIRPPPYFGVGEFKYAGIIQCRQKIKNFACGGLLKYFGRRKAKRWKKIGKFRQFFGDKPPPCKKKSGKELIIEGIFSFEKKVQKFWATKFWEGTTERQNEGTMERENNGTND
jgi:hypothetical protein